MSTNTYPALFSSEYLASSNAEVYAVPASPTTIILQDLQLKLTNITSATRVATIYAVPSGGSASDANAVVKTMSIPPFDYILIPVERIEAGGTVEGFADAATSVSIQPIGGRLHTP